MGDASEAGVRLQDHRPRRMPNYMVIAGIFLIITLLAVLVFQLSTDRRVEVVCASCPASPTCPDAQNSTSTLIQYVCADSRVVDDSADCIVKAEEQEVHLNTTTENGTLITKLEVSPACIAGARGGFIYYEVVSPAENVSYELKEVGGEYWSALNASPLFKSYKYFVVCDSRCPKGGDFSMLSNRTYVLRVRFDRMRFYNRTEYSNEHLISLMPHSEYMRKQC